MYAIRSYYETSGTKSGTIELRLDKPDGELIGECAIVPSKNYSIASCSIKTTKGDHALYLVFRGDGEDLFDVDWFCFK